MVSGDVLKQLRLEKGLTLKKSAILSEWGRAPSANGRLDIFQIWE